MTAQEVRNYAKSHNCSYSEAAKALQRIGRNVEPPSGDLTAAHRQSLQTFFAYNPDLITVVPVGYRRSARLF